MNRRLPWFALGGASVALILALVPAWAAALQFDRVRLVHGEFWRLVTGHFVHWNTSHFAWDTVAFVICGAVVEMHSRLRFVATVGLAAFAISAALIVFLPDLARYRGLSGIDSALFVVAALTLFERAWRARSPLAVGLAVTAVVGLALKSIGEMALGRSLFVATSPTFVPLPLAHLVGLAAGLLVGIGMAVMRGCAGTRNPAGRPALPAGMPAMSGGLVEGMKKTGRTLMSR